MSDEQMILQEIYLMLEKYTSIDKNSFHKEMNLIEDLDLDSLEIANMAFDLEKTFHITIDMEELWNINNIEDLVNCVKKKLE